MTTLYVSVGRGRESNHLYVGTYYDPDPDTSHGGAVQQDARDILTGVLANEGADLSAHETVRQLHQDVQHSAESDAVVRIPTAKGPSDGHSPGVFMVDH